MRVAIIGASGQLGRYMVQHVLEDDELIHECPAIVGRRTPSAIAHAEEGVRTS